MVIRFHTSASFKHGISPERIAYVVEHCATPLDEPEDASVDLVPDLWGTMFYALGGGIDT